MGHGRAIINIEDQEVQTAIYQKIVSQNLSVRDTETLVKNYHESLKPVVAKVKKTTTFSVAEEQKKSFANFFGAKVEVKIVANNKGKITIPFHSEEDFNRIIKLIKG